MCFNFTCTPTKQKKTLDYILDWIKTNGPILQKDTEDIAVLKTWKEEVSDDYIKTQIDAAIQEYDWDSVSEFNAKMDKVVDAAENNFVAFDELGNAVDSGYNADSFASSEHYHEEIKKIQGGGGHTIANRGAVVTASIGEAAGEESIIFNLFHRTTGVPPIWSKEVAINCDNIDNFSRALTDPDDVPRQGSNNLITSGGVYDYRPSCIEDVVENAQSAKLYADNQTQGEPAIIIELADNNTPGSPVTKSANIDIDNIDNLNRALTTPSSIPENDATKLITSKAVYDALVGKMDDKTIDSTPANNATHLISSKAVYDYKVLQLPDVILLVLKLAAAEEIDDNLSWDTIDTSAHYYSVTSLTVSDINAYKIGDICKVSNGTTTIYAKVTGVDHSYSTVTFNDAFTSMTTSTITISKLS